MADSREGRQRRRLTATETDLGVVRQRAVLVGTSIGAASVGEAQDSFEELARLVDTAGADEVAREFQQREAPDPGTYIGSGKLHELHTLCEAVDADVVVFNDELTPAQQRNLEKELGRDVVDRVALILDIFAQHATSQEGMVQVELAQLRYRLPRLRGRGTEMSRLGAGIGTRGPGEMKLEVDRRRIQQRISKLKEQLKKLSKRRDTQRDARRKSHLFEVALVGYTNAGKSTLLNRLADADVLVEDRLFSTLDPTTRRLKLPGGETILLSDTVGFVRRLPHELIEAFQSTLEEVSQADVIVHLVDTTSEQIDEQTAAVRTVLHDLHAADIPELLVFNQIDRVSKETIAEQMKKHPGSVAISALDGTGIDEFLRVLSQRLRALMPVRQLFVPLDRGDVIAALHRAGEVLREDYDSAGTHVSVRLDDPSYERYREFVAINSPG